MPSVRVRTRGRNNPPLGLRLIQFVAVERIAVMLNWPLAEESGQIEIYTRSVCTATIATGSCDVPSRAVMMNS